MSTPGPTTPAVRGDRIRESLLRKAGLTQAQIDDALKTERESGQQLDQVLISKNFLTEAKCMQFFAELLGLEWKPSLDGTGVPGVFIHQIPVQFARNYKFFDAPVGLIFTIDRDMELGSWLDTGMFIQSVMIAARGEGLETCSQAAFCQYHDVIQRRLGIPATQQVVCGMALGYGDPAARINGFRTERMALSEFVTWVEG